MSPPRLISTEGSSSFTTQETRIEVLDVSTANLFTHLDTRSKKYAADNIEILTLEYKVNDKPSTRVIFSKRIGQAIQEQSTIPEFNLSDIILLCPHSEKELRQLVGKTIESLKRRPNKIPKIFILQRPDLTELSELKTAYACSNFHVHVIKTNLLCPTLTSDKFNLRNEFLHDIHSISLYDKPQGSIGVLTDLLPLSPYRSPGRLGILGTQERKEANIQVQNTSPTLTNMPS